MSIVIVVHWWSGPPSRVAVMSSKIRGSAKICRPPMVEVMMTKISVGLIIGRVTEVNWRTRPAPSIAADS